MEFELVPLHKNKQHLDDCANILNQEWPRSKAAREHSLNKSCEDLPVCLVFRRMDSHEVVGFSQLVDVQGKDRACLLESVIIRHDLRGTGLGRRLMEATEQFAQQRHMKTVYLNTLDKKGFYTHLGYIPCQPVISLGANASRVPEEFLQKLMGNGPSPAPSMDDRLSQGDHCSSSSPNHAPPSSAPPPPPPPPPPPSLPPPPTAGTSVSRHVLRMDPNALTWMCKQLQ